MTEHLSAIGLGFTAAAVVIIGTAAPPVEVAGFNVVSLVRDGGPLVVLVGAVWLFLTHMERSTASARAEMAARDQAWREHHREIMEQFLAKLSEIERQLSRRE